MNHFQKRFIHIFYITEIILYMSFLIIDIFNSFYLSLNIPYRDTSMLKLLSVLICIAFALYLKKSGDYPAHFQYILVGLFFTLVADMFLLYTHYYAAGIYCFCIVQLYYRFHMRGSENFYRDMFVNFSVTFLIVLAVYTLLDGSPLFYLLEGRFGSLIFIGWIGAVYFIYLLSNIIFLTRRLRSENTAGKLFLAGLIFMLLCDIHVALFNILSMTAGATSSFYNFYYEISRISMWLFYLPALLCILSYFKSNIHSHPNIN